MVNYEGRKDIAADSLTEGFPLDLAQFLSSGVVLVKLELHDASGKVLSDNLYWLGAESSSYRALGRLPSADLAVTAVSARHGDTVSVHVELQNRGNAVALQNKLTLVNASDRSRTLPAYYSDNYVSLLRGKLAKSKLNTRCPSAKALLRSDCAVGILFQEPSRSRNLNSQSRSKMFTTH